MSGLEERAADCVFGRRGGNPYYVVTPRFHRSSAGNRILYALAHALNGVGEEAYVAPVGPPHPPAADKVAGLRAPELTPEVIEDHFRFGRTPIAIYPETFQVAPSGAVKVCYALNYLGLLGGGAPAEAFDLVLAYARNIQAATDGCEDVLYLPVSDPGFWTPGEPGPREHACVYVGKYVEFHDQPLPPFPEGTTFITRYGPDAPTPEELRDLFRRSAVCYVFENTAIATEAALCGCPVVYRTNPFFHELIAAQELGLAGFIQDDRPEELARASCEVASFRVAYDRAIRAFGPELTRFVERTQALARARVYDRPFAIVETA